MIRNNRREQKIFWFRYLLIILVFVALIFWFFNSLNLKSKLGLIRIEKDMTLFSAYQQNSKDFYNLILFLKADHTIDKAYFIGNDSVISFKLDTDLYFPFDKTYYEFKNIINAIQQNRSISASANFISFVQKTIAVKIGSYAYIDESTCNIAEYKTCTFNVNNLENDWQNIISQIDSINVILDKSTFLIFNDSNNKVYDQDQNDQVLKSINTKYQNNKIEIYNSTDISGYAKNVARIYQNMGFSVTRVQNYDQIYTQTTLVSQLNKDNQYKIQQILNISRVTNDLPKDINSIADFVIILGGDTLIIY